MTKINKNKEDIFESTQKLKKNKQIHCIQLTNRSGQNLAFSSVLSLLVDSNLCSFIIVFCSIYHDRKSKMGIIYTHISSMQCQHRKIVTERTICCFQPLIFDVLMMSIAGVHYSMMVVFGHQIRYNIRVCYYPLLMDYQNSGI